MCESFAKKLNNDDLVFGGFEIFIEEIIIRLMFCNLCFENGIFNWQFFTYFAIPKKIRCRNEI